MSALAHLTNAQLIAKVADSLDHVDGSQAPYKLEWLNHALDDLQLLRDRELSQDERRQCELLETRANVP